MKASYSQIKDYGKLWEKYKPGGLMETRALQTQLNPETNKLETHILSEEETEMLVEATKEDWGASAEKPAPPKIENEQECLEISLKIVEVLGSKAKAFKKETGRKIDVETLRRLFLEGCKRKEEVGSKMTHIEWGLAHVNNVLSLLWGCINREAFPHSASFDKAQEDMEEFNLNYTIDDSSQLFLDVEKKKGHNFSFYL